MKKLQIIGIISLLFTILATAEGAEMPSFLPKYYYPIFKKLVFLKHSRKKNVEQYVYTSKDQALALSVENIESERPGSKAIINNIAIHLNNELKSKKGEFKTVTQKEVSAQIHEDKLDKFVLAFALPKSTQIWTYGTSLNKRHDISGKVATIKALANRQRYELALSTGNVSMGVWGAEIYNYATKLLEAGKNDEGLKVLEKLLSTSPFNYKAHFSFIEKTSNTEAAKNSAQIIFKNAEDQNLIHKAAGFLGVESQTFESIPILGLKETGLQLILIPLPPYNPWLLEDSAKTYEKITGIPVKIRRLKEKWKLKRPNRIFGQRSAQNILVKHKKENINFTNWNKKKYITELLKAGNAEDSLSEYYIKEFVKKIESKTGQYFIDKYLDWFSKTLEKYRSNDDRTMYVGITGANIYSGDNNYVFSLHTPRKESQASIFSYHMMLTSTLSEAFESRKRLTERIAKELVPASLRSLKIPRSTDPTCPYSYSSGILRLDQKTLVLSEPVKNALEKIKIQASAPAKR